MIAARHVSENLGIEYDALKGLMTGDNPKVPELSAEVPELRLPTGNNAIYVFALN